MPVPEGYFNIKRDNELIAAGTHFWCEACVVARPIDDKSPDPRYCLECFGVLSHEASLLNPRSRPKWVPKVAKILKTDAQKVNKVSQHIVPIMHTIKTQQNRSVHNSTEDAKNYALTKRGPKPRADLPMEVITQWAGEGMGLKAICTRLKAEYDIAVHHTTILRRLQGGLL